MVIGWRAHVHGHSRIVARVELHLLGTDSLTPFAEAAQQRVATGGLRGRKVARFPRVGGKVEEFTGRTLCAACAQGGLKPLDEFEISNPDGRRRCEAKMVIVRIVPAEIAGGQRPGIVLRSEFDGYLWLARRD